ncbi:hypothetical protein B0H15DRAFT_795307 [Mycena belliarum]|uniref:Uncharacterized protein n=1 Tax=Mycena belliarum TaxID=1033014 RepID=A0AAD6XU01_9AGAR|nr:hypothetical protein B0H15DRAFT_795307 [Mycena belliae]
MAPRMQSASFTHACLLPPSGALPSPSGPVNSAFQLRFKAFTFELQHLQTQGSTRLDPHRLQDLDWTTLDDERLAGMHECRAFRAAEGRLVVHCRLYRGESSPLRGAQRVPCRGGGRLNAS